MPTTFSNWANGEGPSAKTRNGEHERGERAMNNALSSPFVPANPPVEQLREQLLDELREELTVARRRLQYFEGFAPWIAEQMSAVVERAAEVGVENEREQERIAAELERRREEMKRVSEERDRFRDEAQTIVADANAAAEGVIREANARAARLLAEAHREADGIVNRLREEAAAIVSKALGDLGSLEATNANAEQAHTVPRVAEHWATLAGEVRNERSGAPEEEDPRGNAESALVPAEPAVTDDAPVPDDMWTGSMVADEEATGHEPPPAVAFDTSGPTLESEPGPTLESEPAPAPQPSAPKEAVDEPEDEPGPLQWLRSGRAGRDVSLRNGTPDVAPGLPFASQGSSEASAKVEPNPDDVCITRVTMHPAFTSGERADLQRRVEGLPGVERVQQGTVGDDSLELLVTHQLYTSVLGSLLTAAGEHIRLIAQHDDSLEVEITGLEWLHGAGDSEASRALDA